MPEHTAVSCIGCCICHSHCPMDIPIATWFEMYNVAIYHRDELEKLRPQYEALSQRRAPASDCVGCRACESVCPQHIQVSKYMPRVAEIYELCVTGSSHNNFSPTCLP